VSAIEHSSGTAHHTNTSHRPRVGITQLLRRAIRRWQTNRAMNELSRLHDRQLEDIGISRNDIPRVVAGLFHPEEVPPSRCAPESTSEDRIRRAV
jgi:uncharacterized protein YjiS (DUF1127 family)